jgi:signal transduction histidine kinase
MYLPDRYFPALRNNPRFVEALLVPFHSHGQPVGTVWVVSHRYDRGFDREDERVIRNLATFASGGWQLLTAHAELERRVAARTAEITEANIVLKRQIERRRRVEEERKNLLRRLALTQEEESRRIARELHDGLAQRLALLQIDLESLRQNPPAESAQMAARLVPLTRSVSLLSDEVRRVSHRLHPSILDDLGLEAALRHLVDEFEQSGAMAARFIGGNLSRPVPLALAGAYYRIAQEALRNVARHAPGACVTVSLSTAAGELRLAIHDDGPGFDPESERNKRGLGLVSMQERAQLAGANLMLDSKEGAGTNVLLTMPWTGEEELQQ